LLIGINVYGQQKTDKWLEQLLRSQASPLLQHVLDQPDTFQYQLIYTQINRDKNNQPHFKNYYLHLDRDQYFNPASTVKLPVALCALEKLHELHIPGLNSNTTMLTDSSYSGQIKVYRDSLSVNGLPSVAQYIKEIFLISDNDAYNRLYEFVGQQTLNEKLWQKGYTGSRITRRFMPMTEEENRHTNAIRFVQEDLISAGSGWWGMLMLTGMIALSASQWILQPIIFCHCRIYSKCCNLYCFRNRCLQKKDLR